MFERTAVDFGTVARGAECSLRLKFRNIYKEDVHIARVETKCGCTKADLDTNRTYKTGEEGVIELKMDTERFKGRKDSSINVVIDLPFPLTVTVPITYYVRTDVVLTPGIARMGSVDVGSGAQQKLTIAYAGRSDWKILEVKSANPYVEATIQETGRGNGLVNYDLVVSLKKDAPVGSVRDQITLVTDDAGSPYVPVRVEGQVESDYIVTPEALTFSANSAENQVMRVVVRAKNLKPFNIDRVECDKADGLFSVALPKDAKPVHTLQIRLNTPGDAKVTGNETATISESLAITIPGRSTPLLVPVKVIGMSKNSGTTNGQASTGEKTASTTLSTKATSPGTTAETTAP